MSKNISDKPKIKAELLRHLTTVEEMCTNRVPSSGLRMAYLLAEIGRVDRDLNPKISPEKWGELLK